MDIIAKLQRIIEGAGPSGELVTQRAHALQCAALAEQAGAPSHLIAAALLHDIGHLIDSADMGLARDGVDAHHEEVGADYLAAWFDEAVCSPVRLHVAAKRQLCRTDTDYLAGLSSASVLSLGVQGGPFDDAEAAAFDAKPFAAEALSLRRWDELAKDPEMKTPDFAHFAGYLEQCLRG